MTGTAPPSLWTIGHSIHPIDVFLGLLKANAIETLVDVRSFPGSRRHPQFNKPALAAALESAGIAYQHMVSLGGRRKSENGTEQASGGHDSAFSAYAAYAKTAPFREAVSELESLAGRSRVAIMCAEADWRQCHRQFIAAALVRDGFAVTHILPPPRAAKAEAAPELPGL
jgi:uncharacterized protein (DUF488 family)